MLVEFYRATSATYDDSYEDSVFIDSGNESIHVLGKELYTAATVDSKVAPLTQLQSDVSTAQSNITSLLSSVSAITSREDVALKSSLSNLPNNKNYILASISSNQTLSFTTSGWADNTSVHVFVYNSSSSEITVTIPNTGGYVNMSSESLTIPGNTGAEIDAFKDGRNNIWIRHAVGELTINPDLSDGGNQQLG